MTQTFQNYQETVNTLLFGQKAKNVKTSVSVNEVSLRAGAQVPPEVQAELDRANKTINELQAKLKQQEKKTRSEKNNGSVNSYLQEQVEFLAKQLEDMKLDLQAKDAAIEKIVQEKTEYATKFDRLEV